MKDWKETCAKCADGEIEPAYCEYYGEPNGCNSPTYHAHPPVGNAAAMREALLQIVETAKAWAYPGADAATTLGLIIDRAEDAIAIPPRQCDVGTPDDMADRIEAAWKIERESLLKANASMRTCLVNILAEMQGMSGIEAGRKVKFSPDAIACEIRSALAVAENGGSK